MSGEWRREEYAIGTYKARLDIDTIHGFLKGGPSRKPGRHEKSRGCYTPAHVRRTLLSC